MDDAVQGRLHPVLRAVPEIGANLETSLRLDARGGSGRGAAHRVAGIFLRHRARRAAASSRRRSARRSIRPCRHSVARGARARSLDPARLARCDHAPDGRIANRGYVIDPSGRVSAPLRQDPSLRRRSRRGEGLPRIGDRSRRARTAVVADTPWGGLGLSVCYDLRFPHLYRALARIGATMLADPRRLHAADRARRTGMS